MDAEAVIKEYSAYAEKLKPYICDTTILAYKAVKEDKKVLFEGAQGTLLDRDLGTYPYVTSSHPISGGVCVGTGIGPTMIDECIGIAKSYEMCIRDRYSSAAYILFAAILNELIIFLLSAVDVVRVCSLSIHFCINLS